MKHFTHYITRLVGVFAMLMAWNGAAVAASTPFYTFATAKSSTNTAYANNYDVTISGMTWSVPGNQSYDGFVRIGGKAASTSSALNADRIISAKSAMGSAINKIVINHNGVSNANLKVNSITLYIANNSSFNNATTKVVTPTLGVGTSGTIEFEGDWATGSYYKFAINVSNSKTTNYGFDVKSIQFYAPGSTPIGVADPTFSLPAGTYTGAQ